jgi:HAD superfamily hydrolase (TIGR01509 family)
VTREQPFPIDPEAVEAVVFDCDGLLLDTETLWTRAESTFVESHGHVWIPEYKLRLIGTTLAVTAEILCEIVGRDGEGAVAQAELAALADAEYAKGIAVMPGAAELAAACAERVPLAVASNTHTPRLHDQLGIAGLGHLAIVAIGADQVAHSKPAPDLYLAACELLGADPASAVAFEDTSHGVTSALAAGLKVIMVPSLNSDERAHWTVPSLEDARLVEWTRGLRGGSPDAGPGSL